ncbi:unnamed protein product, partial [marine sediment metagenome]
FSLIILTNSSILSQVSINDENAVLISFDGFNGSGFCPDPATGQLDSDTWSVLGLSEGDLNFGDTETEGDFARGISTGGESTGGCYAFDIGSDNMALGVQPGGSDWTPGDLILKVQNNTGNNIVTLSLSYSLWVYNDKPRANSFNFSHSPDNSDYTPDSTLNFTSPDTADPSPAWTETVRSMDLNCLNIPNGSNYYLKWTGDDISGSGSRDEFAIDNITITATMGEADSDPPEFIETYPKISNESNTQFDIVVQLNEVGHIYYIVIP